MITEKQRIDRRKGVGASDSPIIMGFSNYKTPYLLWLEKSGLVDDYIEENELQYWGNQLEGLVRKHFERLNNVDVKETETLISTKHPYLRANLDGYISAWDAVLEIKTADKFQRNEWGENETDIIPMQYLIQVAHQCIVSDCNEGYIAVLIGGNEYRQFRYQRDSELEAMIIEACQTFWIDCVKGGKEPDAITIDDARIKYRASAKDSIIVANEDIKDAHFLYSEIKKKRKQLEAKEASYQFELMEYMKTAECLTDEKGRTLVTLKPNKKGSRVFLLKGF